jgi:GT2 family glycosyltransferase
MSRGDVMRLSSQNSFYDERFPVFWNDVDLAMRAKEEGIGFVLVPSVRVYHSLGHSVRKIDEEFSAMLFYSSNGLIGFARKWGLSTTPLQIVFFLDAIFAIGVRMLTTLKRRHSPNSMRQGKLHVAKSVTRTILLKYRCSLQ